MVVRVSVVGCDDSTHVEVPVDEKELRFLLELAESITEATTYDCQPRLSVKVISE